MKGALFFHKESKKHFYVLDEEKSINCNICKKVIELGDTFYIQKTYSTILPFKKSFLCSNKCITQTSTRDMDEFCFAYLTSIVPDNSKIVSDHPNPLQDGRNMSVFQASELESEHTTDRTKLAGRESLEGAKIGADVKDMLLEKDSAEKDIDGFLEAVKKDKPITPKVIEKKN